MHTPPCPPDRRVFLKGSLAALVGLSLWAVFSGSQRNYAGVGAGPPQNAPP